MNLEYERNKLYWEAQDNVFREKKDIPLSRMIDLLRETIDKAIEVGIQYQQEKQEQERQRLESLGKELERKADEETKRWSRDIL